ncbi:malate dehydrogenase [Macrococcoides bohemicum]|uniref:Malate dehydrogenase n=1 Tax=Macrococcoides bohemicum TaxID=1903056 RepID=A0A4R5Y7W6_9STAP|nr:MULTISPECIES: malate dehydrogenase [Macrococcus]ATD30025.1 malate dehydrogenase [Macrococcus sp. IME1552]MBC9873738.1 malate dehydrogenase [Macrococcus bohemicus]QRN50273.1 malate dehydrogenase [Macrococcus bohemicus]QYA41692.1 malate dehydrogenase [Macrococcus bohemicus]QYA44121.1 malate dehydrogenase [Macrococcus bohemicus]
MTKKKISIVGSGFTGSTAAFIAASKGLADIVLVDTYGSLDPTTGKALDIMQAMPILHQNVDIKASNDYADTKDSDVVMITSGIARKPGMTRDDLVQTNQGIVEAATKEIVKYSPNCIIIVLTNPVDAMTYAVYKASGFEPNRVIGQSGVLDTARFRTFVAQALNVAVTDVTGFVLGGHGDTMVPLIRYSSVSGVPIADLMDEATIDTIIERTRNGGAEIVNLLGTGSAYYAPAAAMVDMAESIINDSNRVLPAIAYLNGEFKQEGIYIGVPVKLNKDGVESIVELQLTDEEQQAFNKSAEAVKATIQSLKSSN